MAETVATHPRIGVIGGGQLARMLVEARQKSPLLHELEISLYCTADEESTRELKVERVIAPLEDATQLTAWAANQDVITFESENVSAIALSNALGVIQKCAPPMEALRIAQDRRREKHYFMQLDIPVGSWIELPEQFDAAWLIEHKAELTELLPGIVKTATLGYDGKGQARVATMEELATHLKTAPAHPRILEKLIPFEYEVSQVSVRARNGEMKHYPLAKNTHESGILSRTIVPAPELRLAKEAQRFVSELAASLNYVGTLAVEFFVTADSLIANEWAPRVHNTGHWSITGSTTSQFENHLRAIAGMPLGECDLQPQFIEVVMWNIIGVSLTEAEEALSDAVSDSLSVVTPQVAARSGGTQGNVPNALHWYGKSARPGRKVGHIFIGADSNSPINQLLAAAREKFQLLA